MNSSLLSRFLAMNTLTRPSQDRADFNELERSGTRDQRRDDKREPIHNVRLSQPPEQSRWRAPDAPQDIILQHSENTLSDRDKRWSARLENVVPTREVAGERFTDFAQLDSIHLKPREQVLGKLDQQLQLNQQDGVQPMTTVSDEGKKRRRKRHRKPKPKRESMWFWSSRSKNRNSMSEANCNAEHSPKSPANPATARDSHAWEKHLLQSTDDKTIQQEVLTLFELIEHHVENYYRDATADVSAVADIELSKLQSRYLPCSRTAGSVLKETSHPVPIIKHCLIHFVVSGMSSSEEAMFSLLPEEFTALPRATTVDDKKKPHYDQALSQFRALCSYLRADVTEDANYNKRLGKTIDEVVQLCETAFAPWVNRTQNAESRLSNLKALFRSAAHTGIKLFYQRSLFVFNWESKEEAKAASQLLIWPSLLKATNESSERLSKSRVIVEALSQPYVPETKLSLQPIPAFHEPGDSLNQAFNGSSVGGGQVHELPGSDTLIRPAKAEIPRRPLPDVSPHSTALWSQEVEGYSPNFSILHSTAMSPDGVLTQEIFPPNGKATNKTTQTAQTEQPDGIGQITHT